MFRAPQAFSSALALAAGLALGAPAHSFCGFYVGKADGTLFNDASKVVMVRDGERTTINMLNDYKGDLREFALVVPVPEVLKKENVKTPQKVLFDRIDAYSAPRLAEYFDPNPCTPPMPMAIPAPVASMIARVSPSQEYFLAADLGVKIEAQYTVGAYDIVILSAKQSDGLEIWLQQENYKIPKGAARTLAPYIKLGMKFFVAKVNLKEQEKSGAEFLSPLAFSFNSEKFMLPIRLGMINARGTQDLVLWVLTRNGRVESTNYRTVKLPANLDIPTYLKTDREQGFPAFYKSMFDTQARREQYRVIFTEYFWDMAWCDPCADNPLSPQELRNLGVTWTTDMRRGGSASGGEPVRITRLHVRYTPETFPEDLVFQETADRENYQTRYVLRHAAQVTPDACPEARAYLKTVRARQEKEAGTLASLTGWDIEATRRKIGLVREPSWWDWFNNRDNRP
jgi:hypothetical protein